MKKTKRLFLEIGFVSLLVLTGCGKKTADTKVTRAEALETLASIQAARKEAGFKYEFDTFSVSTDELSQNTISRNTAKNYAISDDGLSISADVTTVEKGTKTDESVLYRHSNQYKYVSENVKSTNDADCIDRIYFIKKYENDAQEYLYKVDLTSKKYVQISENIETEFETIVSTIKTKAEAIINEYSDSEDAKNYFTSLPASLSEGNEEQYLKKNDNSIYLRATGHDGTPIIASGTQDIYLTRFTDNVCVSSYLHSNDSTYNAISVPENFDFEGGYTTNFPLNPGTIEIKVTEELGGETKVIKDDGNGGLVYEDNSSVEGGYVDYTTGQFFVAAKECYNTTISYEYENAKISSKSYAAVFTEFESGPSNIPLSFTDTNSDGTSSWTKVDSLD